MTKDEIIINRLYLAMYDAMKRKDRSTMEKLFDKDFSISYFNGQSQTRDEMISDICTYKTHYGVADHLPLMITINGKTGVIVGRSYVQLQRNGLIGTFRLQQLMDIKKSGELWYITRSIETLY